jgi:hypothetical protein
MTNTNLDTNNSKNNLMIFFLFTIMSFTLHYFQELSILQYTFKPIEVFMHESGHLLTSLAFGGEIVNFHLEAGSGFVEHRIGSGAAVVSFMGYFSASLLGFLIYYSSLHASKYVKIILIAYCSFFFLFVDGLHTAMILSFIIGIFVASWYLKTFGCYLLRFIGVYVMVSSIYSPTYLWSYSDTGDHISLSNQLMLPSALFIGLWFVIGLFFMYRAFKASLPKVNKTSK